MDISEDKEDCMHTQWRATPRRRVEEARQFQMDMLPDTTPDILDLDISATIQTASEWVAIL